VAACGALLLAILWQNSEPRYEGTSLSDWLQAPQSVARNTALGTIGTNALPWVTRWLMQTNPEPQWRQKARAFLRRNTGSSWSILDPLDRQQLGFTGLYALGTNGAPAAPIVVKLLMSPRSHIQNSAMTALRLMGPAGYRALTKTLEEAGDDRWPSIAAALETMGQPDEDAAEALMRKLAKARLDSNRATCLHALAIVGRNLPGTVQILKTNLLDKSPVVRDAAVIGLCALGSQAREVVPAMISASNMSAGVRYSLVQHLKSIEGEEASQHLTLFLRDPDPGIRSAAVLELAGLIRHQPELIGLIAQQLRDPAVSASALRVLKRAHGPRGSLSSETAGTVTTTLVSLYGELKSTSTLHDADPELKRVAMALQEIDPEIAATIGISSYRTDRKME
jgi:HEAT repeat protein